MIKLYIFIYLSINLQYVHAQETITKIGLWDTFELSVKNETVYSDPFRDVELNIQLTNKWGETINFWGFYDGDQTWKVRFMPDQKGKWEYKAWFSDGSKVVSGEFQCTESDWPGQVNQDEFNPFWLGYKGGKPQLFRSFHVGDRFFATNWDDPKNDSDSNPRTLFLDWLQSQGYNMISVASHYLNRDAKGRGAGWDTPQLWPLDPAEYRKMEIILDELKARKIVVFPFAGFFGAQAQWPTHQADQELYIKYTLARLGHYNNTILNVAGPEPFWRKDHGQYQGAMRLVDIKRLGQFIADHDVHGHILTVHNEKRATEFGDPFIDEPWYDLSTLQGPTTLDRKVLYNGLSMNHHRYKPVYAQETLWTGNIWHPDYSDDQLRKNAYTILFSGAILNFADMNGNSSTGFSGSLDLTDRHQHRHDFVKKVWDWFETIPFYTMNNRQDLVKSGYCLAREGQEYYIYADTIGEVELFVDFPYSIHSQWINAQNPADVRPGPDIRGEMKIPTPQDGDDWILHAFADQPELVAEGNFPDLSVDQMGNLHLVYQREGLRYKKYDQATKSWSAEQEPGCNCDNVKRSDPDVVVDSQGNPHVFCGTEFASWNGKKWVKIDPGVRRDTELIIDGEDNLYLCHRQGNKGGFIGLKKLANGSKQWQTLTDPDQQHKGKNNHVYPDMFAANGVIHLVQRHGPEKEITYRASADQGATWPVEIAVSDDRAETAHIVVDKKQDVFIITGSGFLQKKNGEAWPLLGRKIDSESREQPVMSVDEQNNLYITKFGGRYNIRHKEVWMGQNQLQKITRAQKIGFVETAGYQDYAFITWEEGHGNADEGLEESEILVGILFPDGRVVKLF